MQVKECYLLPRDRQLEAPAAYCEICGAELYTGDTAYSDDGAGVLCCEDCAPDVAMNYLTRITISEEDCNDPL